MQNEVTKSALEKWGKTMKSATFNFCVW